MGIKYQLPVTLDDPEYCSGCPAYRYFLIGPKTGATCRMAPVHKNRLDTREDIVFRPMWCPLVEISE